MTTDTLVATGDPDADAYLRIGRYIHALEKALDRATNLLEQGYSRGSVMWPPAITDSNSCGYERATDVVWRAPALMDEAWERAEQHYRAARDRRAAEVAALHVGRLFDPAFTLED